MTHPYPRIWVPNAAKERAQEAVEQQAQTEAQRIETKARRQFAGRRRRPEHDTVIQVRFPDGTTQVSGFATLRDFCRQYRAAGYKVELHASALALGWIVAEIAGYERGRKVSFTRHVRQFKRDHTPRKPADANV